TGPARLARLRVLPRRREHAGPHRRSRADRTHLLGAPRPPHARLRTRSFRMSRFLRVFAPLVVALGTFVGTFAVVVPPAGAADQINGSGSTWSQIAVDQWRADVARRGLSVNYQGLGSSAGRQFYIQAQSDFAVSEIPFQPASYNREGVKLYDEIQAASRRPYAYLPIVAGGTSIMYHLDVNGKRITDLHLSGQTITKIF